MPTLSPYRISPRIHPDSTYIYALLPLYITLEPSIGEQSFLTTLTSSPQSVTSLSLADLGPISGLSVPRIHAQASPEFESTCLTEFGRSGVLTASSNGEVHLWDFRSTKLTGNGNKEAGTRPARTFRIGGGKVQGQAKAPKILCMAARNDGAEIAVGTEFDGEREKEAGVYIFDARKDGNDTLTAYVECHSDDITQLEYHPFDSYTLLSGSTDGLVNIYDTRIEDETDALVSVFNLGSSIHKAAFLPDPDTPSSNNGGSTNHVCALSSDETMGIFKLRDPGFGNLEDTQSSGKNDEQMFGDIRPILDCQYAIDICTPARGTRIGAGGGESRTYIATGTTSTEDDGLGSGPRKGNIKLVPLSYDKQEGRWAFNQLETLLMEGGHGEDITRAVYIDEENSAAYSGGEDGLVKLWVESWDGGQIPVANVEGIKPKNRQSKKGKDRRYQPY